MWERQGHCGFTFYYKDKDVHVPHIVCQVLCEKVDTTTIKGTNQKAEIINTSLCILR